MTNEQAILTLGDITLALPVITGSRNEKAIDISGLRGRSGYITLDKGYKNTGSTLSDITFLDGEKGMLAYRGYPIEELASGFSFVEIAHLLIYGSLPDTDRLLDFQLRLGWEATLHSEMMELLGGLPHAAHPMALLAAAISLAGAYEGKGKDGDDPILQVLAQMPIIAGNINRKKQGMPLVQPDPALDYVENFLHVSGTLEYHSKLSRRLVKSIMNKLLILHADHEQNCSTSTVRMIGSADADLHASIAGGIHALSGPLHGGANQQVIEMLAAIAGDGGDCAKWITKAKDKNDPFRLMGFGHRVYRNFDPRAVVLKQACDELLAQLGDPDPLFEIAKTLEQAALNDAYFIERKLYPNVDFYSGIIYRALGFPAEFFTVLFALGRTPGWLAHWCEMKQKQDPIGRPRQLYCGPVNAKAQVK